MNVKSILLIVVNMLHTYIQLKHSVIVTHNNYPPPPPPSTPHQTLQLTSAIAIPDLFFATFCDLMTDLATRHRNDSISERGSASSTHGNAVAIWKNDKSGYKRLK